VMRDCDVWGRVRVQTVANVMNGMNHVCIYVYVCFFDKSIFAK
jgi:hypothetical protein